MFRGAAEGLKNGQRFAAAQIIVIHRDIKTVPSASEADFDNAYVESSKGKPCDECLSANQFQLLDDATVNIDAWRRDFNEHRPRDSLSDLTPGEFVELPQTTKTAAAA